MSALPLWATGLPEVVCAEIARARDADRSARRSEAREAYERIIHRLPPWPMYGAAATGLMRWIARTHMDDANLDAAADCLEAALASAQAQQDEGGVAHAINMLAAVSHTAGQLDDAERLYEEARTHAFAAGEHELAAMVQQNLGVIANIRGDLRDALTHYHASLDAYRALGLDARAGLLANNLGMVYTDLREWPAAERAFEEARASCRARGDVAALLRVETNLAELWVARGEVERARALCAEVLEASREHVAGPWLGDTHRHYGAACLAAGALEEAETHLVRAAAIAEERRDPLLAAETSRELAELFARLGRHRETLKHLNQAHGVFERLRARRDLADVARRLGRLEERYLELVAAWSNSIEQADPYTKGHCERVADLACALAACVGFGDQPLFWVRVGALLHDVGKIVVPQEILNKPGKLTPEERAIMERHAPAGATLLADVEFPDDVLAMVRSHHERWDGSGYPDRLAGEETPLAARILCVADVYDALTTARSYRAAFSRERALEIMRAESGTTFEPALLTAFISLVEAGAERKAAPRTRMLTPPGTRKVAMPKGDLFPRPAAPPEDYVLPTAVDRLSALGPSR